MVLFLFPVRITKLFEGDFDMCSNIKLLSSLAKWIKCEGGRKLLYVKDNSVVNILFTTDTCFIRLAVFRDTKVQFSLTCLDKVNQLPPWI